MNHRTTPQFWKLYDQLPASVRRLADKNFQVLKADPSHPSLNFKRIDKMWSVRVGLKYRALGVEDQDSILWFWIGSHADYDKLMP